MFYIIHQVLVFPLLVIVLLVLSLSRKPYTGIPFTIFYMLLNIAGAIFCFTDRRSAYLHGSDDSHMLSHYSLQLSTCATVGAWWVLGLMIIAVKVRKFRRQPAQSLA